MSVVAALNAHVAEGRRLVGIIEGVARDVAALVGLSLKAGNGALLRYRGYERVEMDDFYPSTRSFHIASWKLVTTTMMISSRPRENVC